MVTILLDYSWEGCSLERLVAKGFDQDHNICDCLS